MSGTASSFPFFTMNGKGPNEHQVKGTRDNGEKKMYNCSFQMPLHYPRYKKSEYETMPEWQLDRLLTEYGLPVNGDVEHKRKFAMGTFLWPCQNN